MVAASEGDALEQVCDVITSPPRQYYRDIKDGLVGLAANNEQKLMTWLSHVYLGERKSSQLSRSMQDPNGNAISESTCDNKDRRQMPTWYSP